MGHARHLTEADWKSGGSDDDDGNSEEGTMDVDSTKFAKPGRHYKDQVRDGRSQCSPSTIRTFACTILRIIFVPYNQVLSCSISTWLSLSDLEFIIVQG